jgi:SAM-dependent methyltransferase
MKKTKIKNISNYISMGRSSSFHTLNADDKLSQPVKVVFRIVNFINNLFPNSNLDKGLEIKDFNMNKNNMNLLLSEMPKRNTPSRKLCNLFWYNLPWDKIKEELKEINILDIGCSTGAYAELFMKFSRQRINSYIGIDLNRYKNWDILEKKYSNIKFYKCSGDGIPNLPTVNLIITQAALEHIKYDVNYFKSINKFVTDTSKNIIQYHLLPSKACFNTYKVHGVRQYTPRTVSKITKIFKNNSYKILFNLGGERCNLSQVTFAMYPNRNMKEVLRNTNIDLYAKLTNYAIKKDMEKIQKHPAFYALLIHSNYKNKIN